MKLSKLLSLEEPAYWYILGALYSFKYKNNNDYIVLFCSKRQAKTNHFPNIEDFNDQMRRLTRFFDFDFLSFFKPLNEMEFSKENTKFNKWIGYGMIVENDKPNIEIDLEILKNINSRSSYRKKINFLRGVFDSRSSIDIFAQYLSMDLKKNESKFFAGNIEGIIKSCNDNINININYRSLQPTKTSRAKNPQLRINPIFYFGLIGTFRINYLKKSMIAKWWNNIENNSNVPLEFDDLIKWDTTSLQNKFNSKKAKIEMLAIDQEYSYISSEKEKEMFFKYYKEQEEKEKYDNYWNKERNKNKRNQISKENIELVLQKSNAKDFLDSSLKIEKNKSGKPLLDIHHIIPFRYKYLFKNSSIIDSIDNLIAVTQTTHYLLHRGEFSSRKIEMLKKLFNYIENFLNENKINITFEEFKSLY
ncbi:MAG: HNH endonuclease signature motif containing protein [Metamycoplasmataceae bacterium]